MAATKVCWIQKALVSVYLHNDKEIQIGENIFLRLSPGFCRDLPQGAYEHCMTQHLHSRTCYGHRNMLPLSPSQRGTPCLTLL